MTSGFSWGTLWTYKKVKISYVGLWPKRTTWLTPLRLRKGVIGSLTTTSRRDVSTRNRTPALLHLAQACRHKDFPLLFHPHPRHKSHSSDVKPQSFFFLLNGSAKIMITDSIKYIIRWWCSYGRGVGRWWSDKRHIRGAPIDQAD